MPHLLPVVPNPNAIEADYAYLGMARLRAKSSKANRSQVGAILVKNTTIISDGYNGTAPGRDNVCEHRNPDGSLSTHDGVYHAEENALAKLTRNGGPGTQGATMYLTLSPCKDCADLMINVGITRVVYSEIYRDDTGIKRLKEFDVQADYVPLPLELLI